MLTKQDVLREIPLRKQNDLYVPYKDFLDIKRIVESQKVDQMDLEFFKREILARKAKLSKFKEAS